MREEVGSRPSRRAAERLAGAVGADVDGLRTSLRRALDEADSLQAGGRSDLAVAVLEEQRDVLVQVHRRLESRLADAAVECEAERVVAAAVPADDQSRGEPVGAAPLRALGGGLRLLTAAVAAVLGVTLLAGQQVAPGRLGAAGGSVTESPGASDPDQAPAAVHAPAVLSRTWRPGTAPGGPRAADAGPAVPAVERDAAAGGGTHHPDEAAPDGRQRPRRFEGLLGGAVADGAAAGVAADVLEVPAPGTDPLHPDSEGR